MTENRSEEEAPEESGADGTQSHESSATSLGTLVDSTVPSGLVEHQIPEFLSALNAKHPRLFGGEVAGAFMHTLQKLIAERSEQRELELTSSRREVAQLREELTTVQIENSVLKEKLTNLRDRAKMTEVLVTAGGILSAAGLGWAWQSPASFPAWGVSLFGILLIIYGFFPSRRSQ